MTLPSFGFRRHTGVAARFPLLWRAKRLSFNADSGQTGTFVQVGWNSSRDEFGGLVVTRSNQASWDYNASATAPVPLTLLMEAVDSQALTWPLPIIPQVMCGMIDFIEVSNVGTANRAVWDLSNGAGTGARIFIASTGSFYRLTYTDGTTTRTSTLAAAPGNNQRVRLRWSLTTAGVAQLWQSIEGGAETTGGAASALALPAAWAGTTCRLGKTESANYSDLQYIACVVALGNLTQAQLLAAIS